MTMGWFGRFDRALPLLAAALIAALSHLPLWQSLDHAWYDRLLTWTAPTKVELPVTVVAIDEASFAALGIPWPWPRRLHAQLLDRLREAQTLAVGFDVVMAEASADPADDAQLAQAIQAHGAVVLAADMVYSETGLTRQWLRVEPHHSLLQAGARSGFAAVTLDADGVQRAVPSAPDSFWRVLAQVLEARVPGAVARPEPEAGERIRYTAAIAPFAVISYHELLDPDTHLPPHWREFLRDNIVLVGRHLKASDDVGAAQSDLFRTPFFARERVLTPGVEVHAQALASMVTGQSIRMAPLAWLLLAQAGALALVAALGWRWQPGRATALTGMAVLLALGGGAALLDQRHLWLPLTGVAAMLLAAHLTRWALAWWDERRQRQRIKTAFARYLAPELVEQLAARPEALRLGGQRQALAVLFTDLAGFTEWSEAHSAEQVAELLNRHLSDMTAVVLAHGGTVDKFIGDAVMAFWGAPVPCDQPVLRAVTAAQAMQARMAQFRASTGLPLHMRVGVHWGDCIVGNLGGDQRFSYTAVGDVVNVASRLEGANKTLGTQVLVSDAAVQTLTPEQRQQLRLQPAGEVPLKGKQHSVPVWTLSNQ
jgi:adenylate cyclase